MRYEAATARRLLRRTPPILRAMVEDLPSGWLDAAERPGAWSPREVVQHLADLEQDDWVPRARTILEHGPSRPLAPVDRERFRTRFASVSLSAVLDAFATARESNLRALDVLHLDSVALAATGRHPALGEVRLSQLLSAWVVHDLTHLNQINRAIAWQYREEVGPWIEYLSILRPRGGGDTPAAKQ